MKIRKRSPQSSIHESFSDVALLMLATFVFLLVTILITTRLKEDITLPKLVERIEQLESELQEAYAESDGLSKELTQMEGMQSTEAQVDQILDAVGLDSGAGRKDFELFIKGLQDLPGTNIHMVIDTTGSMHGAATFLIPVLRVIVTRSGKELNAITWFADGKAETYQGTVGEMFDQFMLGAPFVGGDETIGDAFFHAAENAAVPGAYVLLGDEPSDDRIYYLDIPAPVFTIPIGQSNPFTNHEYKTLAEKTGGRMMRLQFQ